MISFFTRFPFLNRAFLEKNAYQGYHGHIIMSTRKKKFYITTAIDYVNAKPHIGHALEKIQADVVARFHRRRGEDVFFLTGADEHGVKIVRAADAAKKPVADFVDEQSGHFRQLRTLLNLSWNDFIRTSDQKRHWPGAQALWMKLHEAGDLYKKKYRGLYCVGHEAFVTEKDLTDGKCRDHQKAPEAVEEENWFFRLSKYAREIESRIKNQELRIIPETRKNEILSLFESGLEDVSFSRPRKDLSWGIPVPNDPEHTMYVWCDALANYITAIGYGSEDLKFEDLWPADAHIIGKDILRFHAAIWPGMLLSVRLPLPKSIFVHGFITVDGEKMSKTIGNVIDPAELVKKYSSTGSPRAARDAVRYYLLREIPSGEDGDFSYKKFEDRYNGDLANGIGNLIARVATLGERVSPLHYKKDMVPIEEDFKALEAEVRAEYEASLEKFRFNDTLGSVWRLVGATDKYINDTKPWSIKEKGKITPIIASTCYRIDVICELLEPFLPETAEKIKERIAFDDGEIKIKKGNTLFPRLK